MTTSDDECRLLALERRYFPLGALTIRITAAEQSLAARWATAGFGATPAPSPTPNTTISGTITGCNGIAYPGQTITFNSGGTLLGSVSANGSGGYTLSIFLASNTAYTATVVPSTGSGRFATTTQTGTITAGSTNTIGFTVLPSAGYACFPLCLYPVKTTLILTDSMNGAFTLTYNAGPATWTGCSMVSLPGYTHGSTTCLPVSSAMAWTLSGMGGGIFNSFKLNSVNLTCAVANTCTSTLNNNTSGWTITRTCWTPTTAFGVVASNNLLNVGQFYRSSYPGATITE